MPTFVNLSKKELLEVIEYLRDKEDMFILKEPFLNLRDYLFAFFHVFRKLKFNFRKLMINFRKLKPNFRKLNIDSCSNNFRKLITFEN